MVSVWYYRGGSGLAMNSEGKSVLNDGTVPISVQSPMSVYPDKARVKVSTYDGEVAVADFSLGKYSGSQKVYPA